MASFNKFTPLLDVHKNPADAAPPIRVYVQYIGILTVGLDSLQNLPIRMVMNVVAGITHMFW